MMSGLSLTFVYWLISMFSRKISSNFALPTAARTASCCNATATDAQSAIVSPPSQAASAADGDSPTRMRHVNDPSFLNCGAAV